MPTSEEYESHPFTLPASSPNHTRPSSQAESNAPSKISQPGRSKALLAGETAYKPTRYIVHNDLEEANPDEQEELVELPPQYADRRDPATVEQRATSNSNLNRQPSQHLNLGTANWI